MKARLQYEELLHPLIRQRLSEQVGLAEKEGMLTADQLSVIYEHKWFLLFVPERFGGLQSDLLQALLVQESLARIDGSLGWTVTLCSGAGLFFGYLRPDVQQMLFGNANTCLGGSGLASGTAERFRDGYRINGHWKYATGAPHLTAFTANCIITEAGTPVLDREGNAMVQSFVFKSEEVKLHEDWKTFGLIATASHSYSVSDLFVSADRSFTIGQVSGQLAEAIYRYPFMPFAEATLAVNTLGMVQHFLTSALESLDYSRQKERKNERVKRLEGLLDKAVREHNQLRRSFYQAVGESFKEEIRSDVDHYGQVSKQSRLMTRRLRKLVFSIYPYLGMWAADREQAVNRVWRDLFTASQHQLLL